MWSTAIYLNHQSHYRRRWNGLTQETLQPQTSHLGSQQGRRRGTTVWPWTQRLQPARFGMKIALIAYRPVPVFTVSAVQNCAVYRDVTTVPAMRWKGRGGPLLLGKRNRITKRRLATRMDPIRITAGFAYGPLINPRPSLSKISYKYNNSMLSYILVSFLFSFKKGSD